MGNSIDINSVDINIGIVIGNDNKENIDNIIIYIINCIGHHNKNNIICNSNRSVRSCGVIVKSYHGQYLQGEKH